MSADIEIISVIGANGQPLPIHGSSIGSNWNCQVKQERPDDAEIQELATKMKEAQKEALAKQQLQAAQLANRQALANGGAGGLAPPQVGGGGNGQTNILTYLNRQRGLPNHLVGGGANTTNGSLQTNGARSCHMPDENNKKPPTDEESQKGHFGWTTFGKTYIPYIFRVQEKYCSVRMVENKLLNKYLHCLHADIYSSCTCVRSYYITQAEANLLHDINSKHCDYEFTKEAFTQKDLIVRLSDATKFYQFLDICYRKLISGSKSPSEKCGFIRINKDSVVPYTVRNGEQVVPLFYFEGETENLKQKADLLSGWDLAYLKFCCKVQGIRNELFSSENVAVISLTDIKSYFPNGTEFEDYWPSKVVDSNLLIGNRTNSNNTVNWTRQPSQPPPKSTGSSSGGSMCQKSQQHSSAAAVVAAHQQSLLKRGQSAAAAAAAVGAFNAQTALMQQPNAAAAAAAQRLHSNAALAQATVQALANGSWMSQPQNNLPLLHAQMLASQAHQTHAINNRNQYRTPMENMLLNNRQSYTAYNNPAISMQPVNSHNQGNAPPPLVRSAGGGGQNNNHMSSAEQTLLQQQTHHQQQQIQQQPHQQKSCNTATAQRRINININLKLRSNSPTSLSPHNNNGTNGGNGGGNAVASAAASASVLLRNNNFNLGTSSAPSTVQDYNNLALWNQLTPNQRLMLTQHFKSAGTFRGANTKVALPSLPSLPLDTDLTTMLDYNSPKAKVSSSPSTYMPRSSATLNHKISMTSGNSCCGAAPIDHCGGIRTNKLFTKPLVPPLIPVASVESPQRKCHHNYPLGQHPNTLQINSSAALEDFEKKFKMNDEMRAVVQKVLSNPDLSTFIQTNASNAFVPFMSPPMSPASGNSQTGSQHTNNSVSIVTNPHVTVTPQISGSHFSVTAPSESTLALGHFASSASTSPLTIGSNRQKSVICSTVGHSLLPSPAASSSNSSVSSLSPSPNRNLKNAYSFNHNHIQTHPQQQHLSSSSTPNTHIEVIDLSSPRRSLQTASAYIQQQQQQAAAAAVIQQQQQHRMAAAAAAAVHLNQQNGRSSSTASMAQSGGGSNVNNANNSASMHLQRHAAMAAAAAATSDNSQRLSIIPEIPASNLTVQPYKMQKVFVENHLVPCINMKAYNDSEQLMTLSDFQKYFFPTIALEQCKCLIETLGVELYRGNRRQIQVLVEHDRTHNENIPLVCVRDVIKYMTQLTFMIRNQEQPPNKRSRIS